MIVKMNKEIDEEATARAVASGCDIILFKMDKTDYLKLSVDKITLLHKLVLQKKGESEEADKIRNELDELAKHIPEEQEWMRKFSASLYGLTDTDWLELLGDIQQNESVDGNDIVREVSLHKFKILWSFESNYTAREAFKQWYKQYQDYYDNPENYK